MSKLLELAKTKLGCGYVWGTQGETLTPDLYAKLKKTYGESNYEFGYVSASKWMGKECFDCSGLVVYCLRLLGCISKNADYSCDGLYKLCTPVKKADLRPGDLVFIGSLSDLTHVGIYSGNGKTIEAMGTSKGVVEGIIERFGVYGRLKFSELSHTWEDMIDEVSSNPNEWKEAIKVAVNAAKANGNLGALEIFKFLPELVVKLYNRK